jgi:hypothetical protein
MMTILSDFFFFGFKVERILFQRCTSAAFLDSIENLKRLLGFSGWPNAKVLDTDEGGCEEIEDEEIEGK